MRVLHSLASTLLVTVPSVVAHAQPALSPAADDPSPAATTTVSAEPGPAWTFAVAPRLGVVVPTSKLGAMVVGGLAIDIALPALERRLTVGLDASITRPSYDGSVMDPRIPNGAGMYTIDETELVVGATLGLRLFPSDRVLVPWVTLGPVLHMLRTTETTTLAPGDNTATSTELGVQAALGVDYRVGPGFVLGGARIVYSKLDHVLTGDTNAGKLAFEAGYRIVF